MTFRFIYRTMNHDYRVIQLPPELRGVDFRKNFDIILGDISPGVMAQSSREYLLQRGWLYIGERVPNKYEAADIERICLYGNREQVQAYYNRAGEFSAIVPDENKKKDICAGDGFGWLF